MLFNSGPAKLLGESLHMMGAGNGLTIQGKEQT